jgi:hypothetical protein
LGDFHFFQYDLYVFDAIGFEEGAAFVSCGFSGDVEFAVVFAEVLGYLLFVQFDWFQCEVLPEGVF